MDRESMKKLRLDRRLIRRRGWIRSAELERELSALPDVSHKVAPVTEEDAPDAPRADGPADFGPADPEPEAPPHLE